MTMKQYSTVEEMIKAKAEETHESNLNYGGVFDENNNRISDIEFEIECASKKVFHVSSAYSEMKIGVKLPVAAKYIKNFGYVELN
ncbi:MAG: hypothetical protein KAJ93_01830 [Methanosarcinales archaeon]|nr:hypothetical protein [Methanosarcinales archaeon]